MGAMTEIERIADQLARSRAGEAWHGPSLADALGDVTAEEAAARPLASAHSIWELVHHLRFWNEIPRRRIAGEALGDVEPEASWPPVEESSEAAWAAARRGLDEAQRALETAARDLPRERLAEPAPGTGPDVAGVLHGVAQHNAYHGGQIVLLKRALRSVRAGGAS